MRSNAFLVLACLVAQPVFSQSLPDEINYAPYESRFRDLGKQLSQTENQLGQSKENLQQAQKFIVEMTSRISTLQESIRQAESQISENQRLIPELDRQITVARSEQSRIGNEIRALQSEESSLHTRHQQEYRILRPMEDSVSKKQQRISEMQRDLVVQERLEKEALTRLSRIEKETGTLEHLISQERARQVRLKNELSGLDANVAALRKGIEQLEAQNVQLNAQHAAMSKRLQITDAQLQDLQTELTNLRNSGGTPQAIKDVERKISAMTKAREKGVQELNGVVAQLNTNSTGIKNNQVKIAELERNHTALPAQIQASEVKEREYISDLNERTPILVRARDEHSQVLRRVRQVERTINEAVNDLRPEESRLVRQRKIVEDLSREISRVQTQVNDLSSTHQSLNRQVNQLDSQILNLQNQIPKLQASIRQGQSEITQGNSDLVQAQEDEKNLQQTITRQESMISQLRSDRSRAESEMSQRLNLYNKYLSEAQASGAGQAAVASTLGEKEGTKMAQALSQLNGKSVGSELGLSEAKYWGHVRGEIIGHEQGYAEGLASAEDRSRGELEGSNQGKRDAHTFAQSNFRPVFFEELLQDEFKRPILNNVMSPSLRTAVLKNIQELNRISMPIANVRATIDPLNSREIERSKEILTSLDELISNFAKEVRAIESKSRRLSSADVIFQAPSKVPFGSFDCSRVYKGLADFKTACQNSYMSSFSSNYHSAVRDAFSANYTALYEAELSDAQLSSREASYRTQFSLASNVGHAHGLKLGKEEIFQQSFATSYRSSYDLEMPTAREKAKFDAGTELNQLLSSKAILTLSESSLMADEFRGGEIVSVSSKVKNISKVPLNGAAVVRITSTDNAEVIVREAVLNTASPRGLTNMPDLKIRVSPQARSGQKVVVRGVVELPGDIYRSQRVERFELVQTLVANPAHQTNFLYDNTPSIKGFFRRNIHFLNAKISPTLDDISLGYKLTLTAVGENANLIEIRETSFDTGALNQGAEREVRYSYVFPDSAKNKMITLEFKVIYGNKVIKTERIELRPH